MILNNLKKEGSKLPVPALRLPFPESVQANGHNFTLSSGLCADPNTLETVGANDENEDPTAYQAAHHKANKPLIHANQLYSYP